MNVSSKKKQSVLLLRPDNIGDFVLFSGALKHVRDCYPSAHITLAVQKHVLDLVELCPYVDKCIPVEKLSWWQAFKALNAPGCHSVAPLIRCVDKIKKCLSAHFDLLIYPVRSPNPAHLDLIDLLNVKEIVGINGCDLILQRASRSARSLATRLFSRALDVSEIDPWCHDFLTTVDFLNFLGCSVLSTDEIQPEFWLSGSEVNYIDDLKCMRRKIIGLFPGASNEIRLWQAENYGRLAELLGESVVIALFGGPADKIEISKVEKVIRASSTVEVFNFAGKTTLRELVKNIESCDLFIGTETSGLHIAIASGVRAIGIVGGGHYGRFVPWGAEEKNVFLTHQMDCFHCNWNCKFERTECIQRVTPEEVAEEADRLLSQTSKV